MTPRDVYKRQEQNCVLYAAFDGEQVIGMGSMSREGDTCKVEYLCVDTAIQSRGLGRQLLEALELSLIHIFHWSRQGGISRPGKPTLLPGIAKELLPAGALSLPGHGPCPGCVCGLGMSADFERKLLPAGAGGFPISWGYDKISAGAVGARFYTNKSGAKENHLCRELWVCLLYTSNLSTRPEAASMV